MKKFLMTIAAAFVAVSMSAQNEMYVGGTLNFQSKQGTVDTKMTIAPEFGVKLNEDWGVGAILNYTNIKYLSSAKDNSFRFEPYARYYAFNIGKVNVFVDGRAYFQTTTNEPAAGAKTTDNSFGLRVVPGIAYNLTDNISIVAHANPVFNFDVVSPDGGDTGINVNFLQKFNVDTFNFGFYYNF